MNQHQAQTIATEKKEFFPNAEILFVCTDEQVFDVAQAAVEHAAILSAGNPEVFEVAINANKAQQAANSNTHVNIVRLSKQGAIAKATEQLKQMELVAQEKQQFLETVTANKKGAATIAYKKAVANVEAAKAALEMANNMEDNQQQ
jgi:hypothetical protein